MADIGGRFFKKKKWGGKRGRWGTFNNIKQQWCRYGVDGSKRVSITSSFGGRNGCFAFSEYMVHGVTIRAWMQGWV